MKIVKYSIFLFIFLFLLSLTILQFNSVDSAITLEDEKYINLITKDINKEISNYNDEINFLYNIQKAVLNIASKEIRIDLGLPREPKDLFLNEGGQCYDRSRTIEKILNYYGFKTRHIFFFLKSDLKSLMSIFLKKGLSSHAATEVKTTKGWVVVDSNSEWISLDKDYNPVPLKIIKKNIIINQNNKIKWLNNPGNIFFSSPIVYIYGLYSRHGKFFPPYNFIPDINLMEFLYNIK